MRYPKSESSLSRLAFLVFLTFFVSVADVGATADSDYAAGLDSYKRRDYKKAAASFEKAFAQGKSSPSVLLYAGHSYFGAKDKVNAARCYTKIMSLYPRSPESKFATQCIGGMDPKFKLAAVPPVSKATLQSLPPTTPGSSSRRWIKESMPIKVV
ncbi:MAG: outer membrane protein assembly factor BamD [Candidatus Melainabacteria bacterium]|nr:outer membrane protein assembly factor BamD [Candidatus Melainabacteria bacterium]